MFFFLVISLLKHFVLLFLHGKHSINIWTCGPPTFRSGLEEKPLALAVQPIGGSAGVGAGEQRRGRDDGFIRQGLLQGVG